MRQEIQITLILDVDVELSKADVIEHFTDRQDDKIFLVKTKTIKEEAEIYKNEEFT